MKATPSTRSTLDRLDQILSEAITHYKAIIEEHDNKKE